MQNVIYKVNPKISFDNLCEYGFYKTQPKENPWYQCPIKMQWSGGIGWWDESISISKETYEATVECDFDEWTDKLTNEVNVLIQENIILT